MCSGTESKRGSRVGCGVCGFGSGVGCGFCGFGSATDKSMEEGVLA